MLKETPAKAIVGYNEMLNSHGVLAVIPLDQYSEARLEEIRERFDWITDTLDVTDTTIYTEENDAA